MSPFVPPPWWLWPWEKETKTKRYRERKNVKHGKNQVRGNTRKREREKVVETKI